MCMSLNLIHWPGEILAVEKAWQQLFASVGLWTLGREKGEAQFEYFCVSGKRKEQQCGVTSSRTYPIFQRFFMSLTLPAGTEGSNAVCVV